MDTYPSHQLLGPSSASPQPKSRSNLRKKINFTICAMQYKQLLISSSLLRHEDILNVNHNFIAQHSDQFVFTRPKYLNVRPNSYSNHIMQCVKFGPCTYLGNPRHPPKSSPNRPRWPQPRPLASLDWPLWWPNRPRSRCRSFHRGHDVTPGNANPRIIPTTNSRYML